MSGCAHRDPGEFCAACATEATLRGALHELSLIAADTMRGVTDCSTPLFQRVRNIVEMLKAVEAERDAAGAALCAAMPPVPGAKDRTLADLVAQIIAERDRWASRYADAIRAANYERHELDRAFQVAAPDWETVRPPEGTTLRAFLIARLMAERDEARDRSDRSEAAQARLRTACGCADPGGVCGTCHSFTEHERDEARAKYADALTLLRAWSKWQPQTVAAWSQRHAPREAAALAATYERIRGDVEAQP